MEWMEGARALKSSLLPELAAISNEEALLNDDSESFDGVAGVSSDDCWVDGFLDLSDKDFEEGFVGEEEESEGEKEEEEEKDSVSLSSQYRVDDDENSNSSSFSGAGGSGSLPAVPVEDFEDLEWLSHFVDDSASELSLLCPVGNFNDPAKASSMHRPEPASRPAVEGTPLLCFPSPNPAKPRTKRSRPGSSGWTSDSSSNISSPSQSSSTDGVSKPPAKSQKKRPASEGRDEARRRCSHCQIEETPQWRRGPLGPKTLCNACGVRYKSGRLFPEYRPACSPTFSGEVHSNSHRKVLEMRRRKEVHVVDSGLSQMIPSFDRSLDPRG